MTALWEMIAEIGAEMIASIIAASTTSISVKPASERSLRATSLFARPRAALNGLPAVITDSSCRDAKRHGALDTI